MKEYIFSPEEFLYLGAFAGAEVLYGVEDNLSGLSEAELKLRVASLEESLQSKGYLKEDFDGNKEIIQDVMTLMEVCAYPGGVLVIEKETQDAGQTTSFYYLEDETEQVVKMERKEGGFHCTIASAEETWKELQDVVKWKNAESRILKQDGQKERFLIPQKELQQAARLVKMDAPAKAAEIFREAGVTDEMIRKVLLGLQHQTDYYSFLFLDEQDETEEAVTVIFLMGEDFVIGMSPRVVDDSDYVEFFATSREEQEDLLRDGYSNIGLGRYAWADYVYDDADMEAEYEDEEYAEEEG